MVKLIQTEAIYTDPFYDFLVPPTYREIILSRKKSQKKHKKKKRNRALTVPNAS